MVTPIHQVYCCASRILQRQQELLIYNQLNVAFTRPFWELNCYNLYNTKTAYFWEVCNDTTFCLVELDTQVLVWGRAWDLDGERDFPIKLQWTAECTEVCSTSWLRKTATRSCSWLLLCCSSRICCCCSTTKHSKLWSWRCAAVGKSRFCSATNLSSFVASLNKKITFALI